MWLVLKKSMFNVDKSLMVQENILVVQFFNPENIHLPDSKFVLKLRGGRMSNEVRMIE